MEIRYKKGLGQNFIFDTNLLKAIVADSGIDKTDTVLEIGSGAGTLTRQLCLNAKEVFAFEIDQSLKPHLDSQLAEFSNLTLFMQDFLSLSPNELKQTIKTPFKVVANLPYYITTPILFYLLENDFNIPSITILVQKEVAQRLTAQPNSKDYGALTLSVGAQFNAKIMRIIGKDMFTPKPTIDSALVKLTFKEKFNPHLNKTIRALFSMRRKTVVNNLMSAFSLPRPICEKIIADSNIDLLARAEQLSLENITLISQNLTNLKSNP